MSFHGKNLFVVALLMSVGCLSCNREKPREAASSCNLLVQGASIQFNGHVLPLPGELIEWEKVFGKHTRKFSSSADAYIWDEKGIYVLAQLSSPTLDSFTVMLNSRSNTDPLREAPEYWPRTTFKGRLCVDGSVITPDSRVADVNRTKQGQPFSRGYLDSIYSYDLDAPPLDVYVRIDLTDAGTPESFTMDFSDLKSERTNE